MIPKPVPTPTWHEQAVEITADITIQRCILFANTIQLILDNPHNNFNLLSSEDIPLILSVMAHESACIPYLISTDGHHTVGLMQVASKSWTDTEERLKIPSINIFWGIWILDNSIRQHGLELGLAAYNCSLESIENDLCGTNGGIYYAYDILNFWLPRFQDLTDG